MMHCPVKCTSGPAGAWAYGPGLYPQFGQVPNPKLVGLLADLGWAAESPTGSLGHQLAIVAVLAFQNPCKAVALSRAQGANE